MFFGRLWNWAVDVAKMRGSRCPCMDARGRQLPASRVRRQNQCRAVVLGRCDHSLAGRKNERYRAQSLQDPAPGGTRVRSSLRLCRE